MTKKTPELAEECKRLRRCGFTWQQIADRIGVTYKSARTWADEDYAQRYRDQINASKRNPVKKIWGTVFPATSDPNLPYAEIISRKPGEHKTLTAALLGDPTPGRSALDAREAS